MSIVNDKPTPETDNFITSQDYSSTGHQWRNFTRKLERERDEAKEALREIWQSGDAFLPHVDQETTNRWRKAAGWEEK